MSEFQIGITIVTLGFLSLLAYAAWQGRGPGNQERDVRSGQAGTRIPNSNLPRL